MFWWASYRQGAEEHQRKASREMRKLPAPALPAYERGREDYARRQKKREREQARAKDPDVKFYNKLRAEGEALPTRRLSGLRRRYGAQPFPELEERLKAVPKPDYGQLYRGKPYERDVPYGPMSELKQEAKAWAACAEMEKIALGEVSAHTAGRLADCGRRAGELVAAARARYEAREEERRRREEELRERRLREP